MATKSSRNTRDNRKRGGLCDGELRKQLSVRLTDAEYDTIVRMARAEGRTASNYLRFKLFPPKGK